MTPKWDVLGLGCVAVDDLLYLPAFPRPDTKTRVRRRERQCGGLTATALVAAARLGARCAFAGVLGDDEDSRFVLEALRREGVDTEPHVRRDGARPIHSTILVAEEGHTRTILFDLAGSTGAAEDAPPAEVIRSARVLYVDHYGIEGMTRAARIAREAGVAVVADLERDEWPGFDGLLALVDHLIVGHEFAARRTGQPTPPAMLDRLWSADRQTVIVTCGDEGCWYRDAAAPGRLVRYPAFRVEVADTTACGDVFHGAYAATLARGLPTEERVRVASAAAALKASRPGGQAGAPRLHEVENFLRQREAAP